MLQLGDPRWESALTHVYGSAEDIPPLLRLLRERGGEDVWAALWDALFHQGETDTAAFAALPHVVDIAIADKRRRDDAISFAAAVVADAAPERVPAFLADGWFDAMGKIALVAHERLLAGTKHPAAALALVLAANGERKLARDLLAGSLEAGEEPAWICASAGCRACFDVVVEDTGLLFEGAPVARTPPRDEVGLWVPQLAVISDAALAARLEAWFSLVICPQCGARFAVADCV